MVHLDCRPPQGKAMCKGRVDQQKYINVCYCEYKVYTHNAFMRLMEAACEAGRVKPPEENGLSLPHEMFGDFAYIVNDGNS